MGKYLPIIVTARCGSLNRAAGQLGYSHPSLWYIINNLESDLGVKLFHRTKRGVTLTQAGQELLDLMVGIEEQEDRLYKAARSYQEDCIQLGVFPSVTAQWLPGLVAELTQKRPEVSLKLESYPRCMDGVRAMTDHVLTCCFSTIQDPPELDCFPLYGDPYYFVVRADHPLAEQQRVSLAEAAAGCPLAPCRESADPDSPLWRIYQTAPSVLSADAASLDTSFTLALVEQGLGAAVLPGLALSEAARDGRFRLLPLEEGLTRTISLLCQKKARRTPLDNEFIKLVQRYVEDWKAAREPGAP